MSDCADDSGLSVSEIEKKRPFKMEPHQWTNRKAIPKPICKSCGLLLLRNELTDWCAKHGCNYRDHAGYKGALRSHVR